MNIYKNLLAAAVELDIDYELMSSELLSVMSCEQSVPFSYPPTRDSNNEVTAYSLFLRQNETSVDYSYRGYKQADLDSFLWNTNLKIPYTTQVIDSLPFNPLGTVRAVYFPDIPCVEHTDWDNQDDYVNTLGLTIIPSTGNVGCEVWDKEENTYRYIPGNAMLLNDSIPHRVPACQGTRIAVRVFGNIDYSYFDDKIVKEHTYERN
jgi:hypothetical protein|tara:strand:+ start:809 stop:1426 length:618 start_codon:yes stop_codon:yes gene_type:complete